LEYGMAPAACFSPDGSAMQALGRVDAVIDPRIVARRVLLVTTQMRWKIRKCRLMLST
jgi:hypothetical protein